MIPVTYGYARVSKTDDTTGTSRRSSTFSSNTGFAGSTSLRTR